MAIKVILILIFPRCRDLMALGCDFQDKMYQTEEHRQDHGAPCRNLGNPVFSCMLKTSADAELLYRTTSGEYGSRAPTYESSPCVYHPLSQAFSKHLGVCGMCRDTSFNTSLDRSRVCDCPNLHNTIWDTISTQSVPLCVGGWDDEMTDLQNQSCSKLSCLFRHTLFRCPSCTSCDSIMLWICSASFWPRNKNEMHLKRNVAFWVKSQ